MTSSVNSHATTAVGPGPEPSGVPEDLPWIEDAADVAPGDARALSRVFLARLRTLEEGTGEYQYVRGTLIEMNLSLVGFAVRRFRDRGNGETEDITQVGTIGLIKAIDRFDLSREVEFTSFAIPCIVGEIKRFFRDATWAVHVPRHLQELRFTLARSREVLATALNRPPTVRELAAHLDMAEEKVVEGLVAANGHVAGSLDTRAGDDEAGDGGGPGYAETIGGPDPALELFEDLHALGPLLRRLDDRERAILEMRFGQEMTQADIGRHLGLSQMHVSRLLARTLTELRTGLLGQ
ncbi:SigB/SigF/SigG family RNA polymerase sigma factor [Streptomyces ficellus]|uniref:SigB/SigF/SigG family RNA polymerase sigma factor n=1 Tax=Streptomyces ficellus TaxID=1977088 RepID=A0A6I6FWM0_9ACTN|nr:SigB/SigF/SigG family RNA polymerase sigma factor [Streptomyces ficellus]QGV82326.1 SigB/SigF/SigG family RNA polymerase sigma factor [Streptomyces ficellus]